MKSLDLNSTLESFWFLDSLMIIVAIMGFLLGLMGLLLGGLWVVITLLMVIGELILLNAFLLAPNKISIKNYKQELVAKPTAWVRCVLLSDLHAGTRKSENWFAKIADQVNKLKPHIVLIAGDMVVDWASQADFLQPLSKIKPPHGVFYTLGNHDYLDNPKTVCSKLKKYGFYNLTNNNLSLRIHNSELRLSGIDDAFYGDPQKLPVRQDEIPHITLAHEPDSILNIKEGQTDLLLCGHTHAGQIRFPLLGSLHLPTSLGKKVDYGYKVINGIPTIISRGLGEIRPRARWMNTPEIVVIELGV